MSRTKVVAFFVFIAAIVLLFLSCNKPDISPGTPSTLPPPTTTFQPHPIDPINFPLQVSGGRFLDSSGKAVWLTGFVPCCNKSKAYDWPLVNSAGLRLTAEHGGNFAHIRPGGTVRLEGSMFDAYMRAGEFWDVQKFSDPFFDWLREIGDEAESLGIVAEVDLIDGWPYRQHEYPPLSPWARVNNVNGIDAGDCSIFRNSPRQVHLSFLKRIVDAIGGSRAVTWHVSNEISLCGGVSREWVEGIERAVREAEQENGYVHHLFGTQAFESGIRSSPFVDYVTTHEVGFVGKIAGKPVIVNEYPENLSPDEWEGLAKVKKKAGTGLAVWRGDLGDTELSETLDKMEKVQGAK